MPWWTLGLGRKFPKIPPETIGAIERGSITASATVVPDAGKSLISRSDEWQNEVWGYYDTLGEYRYAVDWKSRMMSRVRLFAGRLDPSSDEPVRLDDESLPVELVSSLGGAVDQPGLLADLSTQLDVPGEGFVLAEMVEGQEVWSVRSRDEIRGRSGILEVMSEDTIGSTLSWRPIAADRFLMRVFQPHKRFHGMADSASRAARATMRELELVNRHITAQYLSRLASAGLIVFPEEVTFPVREEFADQPDPFMAEWIEIAAKAIKEPGTASAVIPIPIKVPGEWVDKIQHLDFTLELDDQIIEKRESALKRLATQINIPAEILTGMGAINHWGAWQLEEGALKTSIAPDMELICSALTKRYLRPRLAASGEENPDQFVIWYDMSELTLRPDRSSNAIQVYDRLELSGEALRRETGFDEADKPAEDQLREQGLKAILRTLPSGAGSALSELLGERLVVAPALPIDPRLIGVEGEVVGGPESVGEETSDVAPEVAEERVEPDTRDNPPPNPDEEFAISRFNRLIDQVNSRHLVRMRSAGGWDILHPRLCENHAYSCPYTQGVYELRSEAVPGRSGIYEFFIDSAGKPRIGDQVVYVNIGEFVSTSVKGARK